MSVLCFVALAVTGSLAAVGFVFAVLYLLGVFAMIDERKWRECTQCGEQWVDTVDQECPFCGSYATRSLGAE